MAVALETRARTLNITATNADMIKYNGREEDTHGDEEFHCAVPCLYRHDLGYSRRFVFCQVTYPRDGPLGLYAKSSS